VKIGVLALQGDFAEHAAMLDTVGVEPVEVRLPVQLEGLSGLCLPGGESTTMRHLIDRWGLRQPLLDFAATGAPVFGTCAGMIILAKDIADGDEPVLPLLDVTVRRNAFGRQVDSCETDVEFAGLSGRFHAVLIRAPWVEQAGPSVEVLARVGDGPATGRIVAVRQGSLLATAFHPEVTGDDRVHRLFVDEIVR
jgi:pyridoxal 5'-phosphate synthase pdxT subunit